MIKPPQITCPICGYSETIKKGTRELKSGIKVPRVQCKRCKHKFTPNLQKPLPKGKKHQTGKTSVEIDRSRKAFKPGFREVLHYDKNGKLVGKTSYYEFRRNRSDVNPEKRL